MFEYKFDTKNGTPVEAFPVDKTLWEKLGAKFVKDNRTRSELNNAKKISVLQNWKHAPLLVQPMDYGFGQIYRVTLGQGWSDYNLEEYCKELNLKLKELNEKFLVKWTNNIGKSRRGEVYPVGNIYVPASAANDVKMAWSGY